jgi:DNA-binding MarR family transcriptional regulator
MGDLAREVVTISRTGLTRLVDRLEEAGMLGRQRSDVDRRGMWVVLTPEGEALLRRMWPVYAREIERFFVGVLDRDEAARLREALEQVRAAADGGA